MKQCDDIIELLEDTSFPQMLLIDGAWGSGKTHFVKNYLIPVLRENLNIEIIFFSLYGISSIEDFRDKLISLSLTENPETSSLTKYFGKIVDGVGNNIGERGLGAILSGAAGAYKYKLYSEFDNVILILDDLERVGSDSLKKKILGECLSLVETKNIKSIVVANEDKITCKDDIEKVFIDKYRFGFSHEEVVRLLVAEYEDVISGRLVNDFLQHVTSVGSTNIRVLKRAIVKFSRIKKEIDRFEGVFYEQAYSIVLGSLIRVGFARYEFGCSKDEILESFEKKAAMQIDPNLESDEKQEELERIFDGQFYTVNERLVDYFYDGVYEFDNVIEELQLPVEKTLLDRMKSLWMQSLLSSDEFQSGLDLLRTEIDRPESHAIDSWFEICDMYMYMIEKNIVDEDLLSKGKIIEVCGLVDVKNFVSQPERDRYGFERRFFNERIKGTYANKIKEFYSFSESEAKNDFVESFKQSWIKVSDDVNRDMMHKPIFESISSEDLKLALNNWSNSELFSFSQFISSRYGFNNIEDFFRPEIERIGEYVDMLDQMIERLGCGFKTGCLIDIKEVFGGAYSRLKERISDNPGL